MVHNRKIAVDARYNRPAYRLSVAPADANEACSKYDLPPAVEDVEAPGPAGMSDLEMFLWAGLVLALTEGFLLRLILTRCREDGG